MIGKIVTLVKDNRNVFERHAIILGSTIVGAIIANTIAPKKEAVVIEIIDGEVLEEDTASEQETATED